jgi:spermidine synthase
MTAEFVERDNGVIRIFQYCQVSSVEFQTRKQDVKILDTFLFGKTLFLDGVLQSSVRDENIYHSALVGTIMEKTPLAKTVCIIGGGEGATAREVLKYDTVERIDMIDWDQELVEFFRDFETDWHKGSLKDSKVYLEYSDIFDVAKQNRQYDVVIIDLTDPDMNDPRWKEVIVQLSRWKKTGGSFIMNAGGVLPWDMGAVPQIKSILSEHFPVSTFKTFVPSFCREWAFVMSV